MKIQWEYDLVERPFCEQLKAMGWQWIEGDKDVPEFTERANFREVLLKGRLAAALRKLNLRDGQPWLDDERIARAIRDLEQAAGHRLMEINQSATTLLLKGTVAEGLPDWELGRPQPIRFIDFKNPANNDFLVINQFKVELTSGRGHVIPDAVLFINGIPVAVAEFKSPGIENPLQEAINQLLRYSNQRREIYPTLYTENEGLEKLFHTNQLLIGNTFRARRSVTWGDVSASRLCPARNSRSNSTARGSSCDAMPGQRRLISGAGMWRAARIGFASGLTGSLNTPPANRKKLKFAIWAFAGAHAAKAAWCISIGKSFSCPSGWWTTLSCTNSSTWSKATTDRNFGEPWAAPCPTGRNARTPWLIMRRTIWYSIFPRDDSLIDATTERCPQSLRLWFKGSGQDFHSLRFRDGSRDRYSRDATRWQARLWASFQSLRHFGQTPPMSNVRQPLPCPIPISARRISLETARI